MELRQQLKCLIIAQDRDRTERRHTEDVILAQRDLSQGLAATRSLEEALQLCLDAAIRVSGLDSGGIYLADSTGGLNLACARGLSSDFLACVSSVPSDSERWTLIQLGRPIYASYQDPGCLAISSRDISHAIHEGLQAIAIIPVLHQGQVIACFNVASHTIIEVPESSRYALEAIAAQVGSAIVRIQAEVAFRENQKEIQMLFDTIQDMLFVLDAHGRILKVNHSVLERMGYEKEELVGRSVLDLHPPERRMEATAIVEQMIADQRIFCHIPLVARDGTLIPVETKITREHWGEVDILIGISRDTTHRKQAEEALQESRDYLDKILNSIGDPIFVKDEQHRYVLVNDEYCRFVRCERSEIIGKTSYDLYPKEQADIFWKGDEDVFETGKENVNEEMVTDAHGIVHTIITKKTLYMDKAGERSLVAVVRDITKRKQAEEALLESERKYREFADSLPQIVYELDAQGNFVFANRSAYASIGLTQHEFKSGLNILQTFVPEDRDRAVMNVHRILEGEKIEGQEYHVMRKDRSSFPVVTYSSVVTKDGRAVGLRGVAIDISDIKRAQEEICKLNRELEARVLERTSQLAAANEDLQEEIIIRKRTEEALRESEERFRRLAENAPDIIFHIDLLPEPRLTYISPAIEKTCKYAPDELLANQDLAQELILPGGLKEFEPQDMAQISPDKPIVLCWQDRDGGHIWTEQRRVPVYDKVGRLVAIEGIVRDISEWVKADEKIKASLREKDVMLKEIHHRVKNNLQIISSLLSIQSRQIEDHATQEILKESRNRVKSLALVHENLYRSPDLGKIDFSAYIKKLASSLASSYRIKGQIAIKVEADEVYLGIDMAIPCGLILNELITNSIKHAFPDGTAGEMYADFRRNPDGRLVLKVGDNGIGLPADLDLKKSRSMGLMLVSSLVSQLDGTLKLSSGHGTRFEIEFPDHALSSPQ
ncbi:MAG TPA: PAS domain S-box protein [Methanotrichaceae archaeon]|nr:PAS domain S-box protein [Methanotrichaceae archaeon]